MASKKSPKFCSLFPNRHPVNQEKYKILCSITIKLSTCFPLPTHTHTHTHAHTHTHTHTFTHHPQSPSQSPLQTVLTLLHRVFEVSLQIQHCCKVKLIYSITTNSPSHIHTNKHIYSLPTNPQSSLETLLIPLHSVFKTSLQIRYLKFRYK